MRCNALLFASFLPVVFGQSAFSFGSGIAYPTGGKHVGTQTVRGGNHTLHTAHPAPTNTIHHIPTALDTTSVLSTPTIIPSSSAHLPFTRGTGAHLANTTTEETKPFATGASHPSDTGSSGFANPSGSLRRLKNKTATISPAGRLPFTKTAGLVFINSTGPSVKTRTVQPFGTGVSGFIKPSDHAIHSSTRVSSGFAKPTGVSNFTRPALNATKPVSASGRLPFTSSKGLFFSNSTTGAPAGPTMSILPTATGQPILVSTAAAQVNTSSTVFPTATLLNTGLSSSIPTFSIARAPYANSTSSTLTTFSTIGSAAPSATVVAEYYQCGGLNWKGSTTCVEGTFCKNWNPYYSQYVRE